MSVVTLNRWLVAQAVGWLPLLAVAAWLGSATSAGHQWLLGIAALATLLSAAALWRIVGAGGRVADRVTAARLTLLIGVVLAIAVESRISWPLWAGLLAAVLLDLADGWCARRFGGSRGGAVLDMESDQFTVTLLALTAVGFAAAGPWLLALPAMKHVNVLFLTACGLPAHDPRPRAGDNLSGRLICAGVLAALLVAGAPITPRGVEIVVGLAAVAALAWSFGRDLIYLLRRRRDRTSVPG